MVLVVIMVDAGGSGIVLMHIQPKYLKSHMAPLRSLGNIRSAFDDFYARTGKGCGECCLNLVLYGNRWSYW